MPRYMVHRTWPDKLEIPVDNGGADVCRAVVERNGEEDQITEVRVLDPFFYA
jgi:hypothetical protein